MTTETIVNHKPVAWNLTETETGKNLHASLIATGYDGTTWKGESIPSGRQAKRVGIFHRKFSGKFVCIWESRA